MPRDVTHFRASVERPADFDAFWDAVLAQAAEVPLDPRCEPLPLRSGGGVHVFDASYQSIDAVRVAAWYALPEKFSGPLPALLLPPGYIVDPPIPKAWARRGYAALSLAPRGKLRSNRQYNPGYPGLLTDNIVDRHTYGYRGFYLDTLRGVDFLLSRPEVDPRRIGVAGSSQGGALAIVAAALRPEIRAAAAGVPYLAAFADSVRLASTYPYQEIADYLRLYPERRQQVFETLAYFDVVNFAPRVRCPTIVNVGMEDNVCPPETGWAAFQALGSHDKMFYPYAGCGHDGGRRDHDAVVQAFFAEKL